MAKYLEDAASGRVVDGSRRRWRFWSRIDGVAPPVHGLVDADFEGFE
jgi:hypothetical protein